jgi:NlpC/P60 family putative phage cell wall peptidase
MTGQEEHGARIADAARGWIGTPYRHQGSRRGVGADCLGLVRGVWREVVGEEPEPVAPYSPDWAEISLDDPLMDVARRHFLETDGALEPGRLVLFRWGPRTSAKHAGILTGTDEMIHAYSGSGVVVSPLVPAWRRRIAGVFAFPRRQP